MSGTKSGDSRNECSLVSQNIHNLRLQYDDVVNEVIRIHAHLSDLAESGNVVQSQISEKLSLLRQSQSRRDEIAAEAEHARSSLKMREAVAERLSQDINQTTSKLRYNERKLHSLSLEMHETSDSRERLENTIRQEELRIQMLENDLDAGHHTARDSWASYSDRIKQEVIGVKSAKDRLSKLKAANSVWTENSNMLAVTKSEIERLKKRIFDTQEVLYSLSHKKAIEDRRVDSLATVAGESKMNVHAKLRWIDKFRNESIRKVADHISNLTAEMEVVNINLEETEKQISRLPSNLLPTNASRLVDFNVSQLREEVQESRKLLSREGYTNRFSFIDLGSAVRSSSLDVDSHDDILFFYGLSSKALSLKEHLTDLRTELVLSRETLQKNMETLNQSLREVHSLVNATSSANQMLEAERLVLDMTARHIRDIEGELFTARRNLSSKISEGDGLERETKRTKEKYDDAFNQFMSSNASLEEEWKAARNTKQEYATKMAEIKGLKRKGEMLASERNKDERRLSDFDTKLVDERRLYANITAIVQQLSVILEEKRKQHTEVIAEISQISRRLDDRLSVYDEQTAETERLQSETSDLESAIKIHLSERAHETDKLEFQEKTRLQLENDIREANERLKASRCDL
jgi:chromosome segregation ATPase